MLSLNSRTMARGLVAIVFMFAAVDNAQARTFRITNVRVNANALAGGSAPRAAQTSILTSPTKVTTMPRVTTLGRR